jgi:hypothetical protein
MGKRIRRKAKDKAPPKPSSGNRDNEVVSERQCPKSMRLAKFSPLPNSVPTDDNSSAANVESEDIDKKKS